jgi:hypothetical protein
MSFELTHAPPCPRRDSIYSGGAIGPRVASTTGMRLLRFATILLMACRIQHTGSFGPASSPAPPADQAPVRVDEVAGHWSGDWGDLYLRVEPDGSVRGVYSFRTGRLIGRFEHGVLSAWWCENGSQGGEAVFRFTRDRGGLLFDGKWRYGREGEFRDDWDLRWVNTPPVPDVQARLDDPEPCGPPS